MKEKKKTGIIIGAVAVVVITAIIGVLIFNNSPAQKLKKQLSLGQKYLAELKYDDAVLAFKAAIDMDDKCEEAYVGLAKAYIGLEQYDNATDTVEKGIAAVGETEVLLALLKELASYYVTIGDEHVSAQQYSEAISSYEIALDLDASNEEVYIKSANSYIETGNYEKALEIVEKGISAVGETPALIELRDKIKALMEPIKEEPTVQPEEPKEEPTEEENAEETETEEPVEAEEAAETSEVENEEAPETPAPAAGGTITLADGTTVPPGGSLTLAQLQGASYIIGGSETVWFTAIGGPGPYYVSEDPEPNWAFEAKYAPGTAVSLAQYAGWFASDPSYDYLTIELRGSSDQEYNFHITR